MGAAATIVPIRHSQVAYLVETTESQPSRPQQFTLLELVEAVSEASNSEAEIIATVSHMLASGQVKLCGSFKSEPIERLLQDAQEA